MAHIQHGERDPGQGEGCVSDEVAALPARMKFLLEAEERARTSQQAETLGDKAGKLPLWSRHLLAAVGPRRKSQVEHLHPLRPKAHTSPEFASARPVTKRGVVRCSSGSRSAIHSAR